MTRWTLPFLVLLGVAAVAAEDEPTPALRWHKRRLTSSRREARQAAYAAFRAAGKDGPQQLREALLEIRQTLVARCRSFSVDRATQDRLLQAGKALAEALGQDEGAQAAFWRSASPVLRRFTPVAEAHERIREVNEQLGLLGNAAGAARTPPLAELIGPKLDAKLVELLRAALAFQNRLSSGLAYADIGLPPASARGLLGTDAGAALLQKHQRGLTSKSRKTRAAACEALRLAGPEARDLLRKRLLEIRERLVAHCRSFTISNDTQDGMLKVHQSLEEQRQRARKVGPDKREALARIKAIFGGHQRLFAPFLKRFARLVEAHERIQEIDEQLYLAGGTGAMELNPSFAQLVPGIRPKLTELLAAERAFRDYVRRCLRYNRRVRTSASAAERKVIELTNELRIYLGVRPLAINEHLMRAARRHSAEMKVLGYFSHGSPVPANRSFGARCKREGYTGAPRGENICTGHVGATGAFWAWYNSTGHHRNMINPGHNEIGVGRAGHWTENFGARKGLDPDHPPQKWASPHKARPPAKARAHASAGASKSADAATKPRPLIPPILPLR